MPRRADRDRLTLMADGPHVPVRSRLWRASVPLVLLVAACGREPTTALIGYAYPNWATPIVQAAREAIASWPPTARGATAIRIVYDSLSSGDPPDVEVLRAQQLVELPGLVAVVGHGGSRGSLAAAPIYNAAGVPQVVPTSTSRLLQDAGPWTFALAPNDSIEGAFIGAFVLERLGARRVTVFYLNEEYGAGLRDGVVTELARRGVTVVDRVGYDPTNDLPTLVDASLRRGTPELLVVAGRGEDTGRIARAAWARLRGIRVVAGDGALLLPHLPDAAGPAADSVYVVAFWLPDGSDDASRAFIERFTRITGHPPQSSDAMGRDALLLVAHAIREVGARRAAVRDYLRSLGRTRPPYEGVTGPISFTEDRPPRLRMARLRRGQLVPAPEP